MKARDIAALSIAIAASGCATADPTRASSAPDNDPFEPMNRAVYAFNEAIDRTVIRPVAVVYDRVTPDVVRLVVGNVFSNLTDVWTGFNNLLQFKPMSALNDAARVLINTTLGLYGVADLASELGLDKNYEDFGQTLGVWGVPSGPYLVLPFFGPSTVRDAGGLIVDSRYDPVWHAPDTVSRRNTLYGTRLIETRASLLRGDQILEAAALDRYSLLREGYLQRRRNLVYDGNPPRRDDDLPTYDDDPSEPAPK